MIHFGPYLSSGNEMLDMFNPISTTLFPIHIEAEKFQKTTVKNDRELENEDLSISPFLTFLIEKNYPNLKIEIQLKELSPFVIFLDIDGVLYNYADQNKVTKKVKELFGPLRIHNNWVCSIAVSHFFNKRALKNLTTLIREIEKTRKVWIVISSNWRENRTVDELKNSYFGIHEFSRNIVDKTPDKISQLDLKSCCSVVDSHLKNNYLVCRASEIQYWLNQHPEIIDYAVLDDRDDHLSRHFGERYFITDFDSLLTREICDKILNHFSKDLPF